MTRRARGSRQRRWRVWGPPRRTACQHLEYVASTEVRQKPPARAFLYQTEYLLTDQRLAAWYDEHGPRLYRYALLILADRSAAEDAVQEAFLRLARALGRRRPPEVTFGYVVAIVRNECYSALRRRHRRRSDPAPLIEPAAPGGNEEERLIVDAALKLLPAEQREVIYLKVFEGLTFQEIADRCGISINTAGSRYRYAADALRRQLGDAPRRI